MEANDLHKRFEEAATEYADDVAISEERGWKDRSDIYNLSKDGFLAGAELGYKEAIEEAKKWIRDRNRHACKEWLDKECADFETDMNKLLEE